MDKFFTEILHSNFPLTKRSNHANDRLLRIQQEFSQRICNKEYSDLSIYCAGSLARGDIGDNSDLDLFIFSNEKKPNNRKIKKIKLFHEIIEINDNQKFPELSNDARYLRVYSFPTMMKALGSPKDDIQNLFTARMLLLLESKPLFNKKRYDNQIQEILNHYFRDKNKAEKSFMPLFLLNDLLRFWRTLCLNYELIRDNPDKPWRKKNINLKFSRMLTVFGTILPLIAKPAEDKDDVLYLVGLTPLERLAHGLDIINDVSLEKEFKRYLDNYESFLSMKEQLEDKKILDDENLSKKARRMGEESSRFLHKCLTHASIDEELRKYLIL